MPKVAAAVLVSVLLLVSAWVLLSWLYPVRQSVVRVKARSGLAQIAQAASIRANEAGAAPTLDDVLESGLLAGVPLESYSRARPRSTSDTGLPLVVQSDPCRAVRKGEAWGGIEETLEHDLPACRFVILPDWTVVQIDEPEFQRDIAPRITLTPLR